MTSPLIAPQVLDPDFTSEEFHRDPYRHYAGYRSKTPVFCNRHGTVYLTRHRDCELLLSDRRFLRQPPGGSGMNPYLRQQQEPSALDLMLGHWLIFMDPPRHDAVRSVFSAPFSAKLVRVLEPAIVSVVQDLIDGWRGHSSVDLVSTFASPLPIFVLCKILGIPAEDWARFDDWSSQLTRALDSGVPAEMRAAIPTSMEIRAYFTALVRARSANQRDDFLGDLIAAAKAGALRDDELIFGIAFLILAGHETTKNLIASGVLTLSRHTDAANELRREPDLLESAVEEVLRFDSPFQKLTRYPEGPASFGEYGVAGGTMVIALVGAANRDPIVFADPERFDIRRSPNRHLSFSKGVHACLGTVLARVESRLAFGALLRALPHVNVTGHSWRLKSSFRALERLTLALD